MISEISFKIDPSEFSDKIAFLVDAAIKKGVDEAINRIVNKDADLIERAKAAKRLGITKAGFDKMVKRYEIEPHYIDGKELFIYQDVILSMRAHTANVTKEEFKNQWLENVYSSAI